MSETNPNKPGPSRIQHDHEEIPVVPTTEFLHHSKEDLSSVGEYQRKATLFNANLAGKGRKEYCSSKIHRWEAGVIFGQSIETFPKTVFKETTATPEKKAESNFKTLLALDTDDFLEKILCWTEINVTAEQLEAALSTDVYWNEHVLPTVNEICEYVLKDLPELSSVGVEEGTGFFRSLKKISFDLLKNPAKFKTHAQSYLSLFHSYASLMWTAMSTAPSQKVEKKNSSKQNKTTRKHGEKGCLRDGEMADTESELDDPQRGSGPLPSKRPRFSDEHDSARDTIVPSSAPHSALTYLLNTLVSFYTSHESISYRTNGNAKTDFVFSYEKAREKGTASLICKPDGLAEYVIHSEFEFELPLLVLECKTAVGSGWWKRTPGAPSLEVPVVALSEWEVGETPSSAVEPDTVSPLKLYQNQSATTCSPQAPQNQEEAQNMVSPTRKALSQQQKIGRKLMSLRLEKFRTQHTVELCTALKKNITARPRTKVYGLYISDHLVFPTVFEAVTLPSFHRFGGLDVEQQEKEHLRDLLSCNLIKPKPDPKANVDDSVWNVSSELKYKCTRSPIPLNLFCPSHFRALAFYIRYLATKHTKEVFKL